ncbi:MAG: hypothetical protein RBS19_02460 [Bacteroidales bacterium]|nr:hypothetical protein [Bacteroidales bacterium]MDY0215797.1 hypothetical protein [Bacteroidales bacterium]
MKKSFLFIGFTMVLFLLTSQTYAQAIKNDNVKILKGKRDAVSAEFNIPKSIMENVVVEYLAEEGLKKPSKKKGFLTYEGITFGKISSEVMDYYVKIDGKKQKSKVTFAVSKGYENFINHSEGGIYSKFTTVFNSIDQKAKKAYIAEQTKTQQKVIDKTQKKYDKLVKEGKSLQKDKENIENKIKKNEKNAEGLKKVLEDEQKKLKNIK